MKPQIFLAATLVGALSCNNEIAGLGPPSDPATETFAASTGVDIATMTRMANGIYFQDLTLGTGPSDTVTTDSIYVSYTGRLKDGKVFDTGTNVKFVAAQVIVGFWAGLVGAKEGGKRKIVIPSELGYGKDSRRDGDGLILIPRQSTLIFDIDLLKVYNRPDSVTLPASLRAPVAARRGG